MIVLFIKARLEHVAGFSLPKGYTYTVTVIRAYCECPGSDMGIAWLN